MTLTPVSTSTATPAIIQPKGFNTSYAGSITDNKLEITLASSFNEAYLLLVYHSLFSSDSGNPVYINGTLENPYASKGISSDIILKTGNIQSDCIEIPHLKYEQEILTKNGEVLKEMSKKGIFPRTLTDEELRRAKKIDHKGNIMKDAPGDTRDFYIFSCYSNNFVSRTCICRYVGENCYIYMDKDDGALYNDQDIYAKNIADYFDTVIYPSVHKYIGIEWNPGIDNDPRIYLVFSRSVGKNAYYMVQNEYPNTETISNQCESIYLDPLYIDETKPAEETITVMEAVAGHEFTHMVRYAMKFIIPAGIPEKLNNLPAKENLDRSIHEGSCVFTENILLKRSITDNYPGLTWQRAFPLIQYLKETERNPFTSMNSMASAMMPYPTGMFITHYLYEREGYNAIKRLNQSDGIIGLESCYKSSSDFHRTFDMMALTMILSGRVNDTNYTMKSWDLSGSTSYEGYRLHNAWSFITNCGSYENGIDLNQLGTSRDIPQTKLYEWAPAFIRFFNGSGQQLNLTINILNSNLPGDGEVRAYFYYR
jgi:hypothetical protein